MKTVFVALLVLLLTLNSHEMLNIHYNQQMKIAQVKNVLNNSLK